MSNAWRNLRHRAGRRGAFLLFLAILDVLYGVALFDPTSPAHRFDLFLPYPWWAATWVAIGVVCFIGAFVKKDRWAFTLAATLKFSWGLLYSQIWISQGYPYGWVSMVVWLAFAGVVLIIAGWPEEGEELTVKQPKGLP